MKIFCKHILVMVMAVCMSASPLQAQHMADPLLTQQFNEHVKSIDEFMNRFNGTEAYPGLDATATDFRRQNLFSLLDFQMKDGQKQEAVPFVTTVIDSQVQLDYADTLWYAVALCDVKFKGKTTSVVLVLHPERIREGRYRWVFCGADKVSGNLIDTDRKGIISPVEHEIHFMELQSIFNNDRQHLFSYRESGYQVDQLSAFLALAQAGSVEFEQVSDLKFVFLQVPGYAFTVEEKGRKGANAGWLITSFQPMSDAMKLPYIMELLGKK